MKPFKFRAQAALDVRRRQHDDALARLGDARRALSDADAALRAAEASLVRACEAEQQAVNGPFGAAAVQWHRNWIDRQRIDIARGRQRMPEYQAAVQEALDQLQIARRRLRALEHLRDRRWKAWTQEAERAERKELDQFGTVRYALAAAERAERDALDEADIDPRRDRDHHTDH